MRRLLTTALLLAAVPAMAQQTRAVPRRGLVITRSTTFRPGAYRLVADSSADSALIVVRGNDITVDLAGVELVGAPPAADPDAGRGVAILVDGGSNVTIRNARIRGYRIAIRARGTRNLRLLDNDLSFNWKPRLYSLVEHESLVDWLSYHQNEKDEWLRYGAGIYLRDVRDGEIRGNTIRQGMNALLMTRTDSVLVWNNDFSFNSGLGMGLYRSSYNRIVHNRMDYDVRGYSEGFYRRGQDSAGLLIYEQSDSNVVAHNSITHGGDGLFLWAGQQTMDTGTGGANDNLFFDNDFSWAPTNGMEATFSRNRFVANRVVGSDHGLWGGYSYGSLVAANEFARNRVAIAIEHGQDNRIVFNDFTRDSTAIWLWANPIEPGDWGYPKHRDTRSRNYAIDSNLIDGPRVAFRITQTQDVRAQGNDIHADTFFVSRGDTARVSWQLASSGHRNSMRRSPQAEALAREITPAPLHGARKVLPSAYADWPRSTIIVDEWGPYDWRTPKLWPVDSSTSSPLKLRVLGPKNGATWRVQAVRGATLSRSRGAIGDTVSVTPAAGAPEDWVVTLRSGNDAFSYSRFDPRAAWRVKVFAFDSTTHPITAPVAFAELLEGKRGAPALELETSRLDYMWYRPPAKLKAWPGEHAGVVATTTLALPAGRYAIRTISDDGIRVYVDGQRVIDDWSVHESRVSEAPLAAGRHEIRVEYWQGDGWAELRVEVLKR